jgi:BCD family chlorophyll transporter-like MFS transporter
VLVLFGLGFGIFTVGGVSLLMAMSSEEKAGVYMALWTMVQLTSRGAGIAAGGVLRDVALALTGQHSLAYATVFFIEAAGLLVAIALLRRADIRGFAARRDAGL